MPLHFRRTSAPSTVTIDAPARLHLSFLDPSGSLGRVFGSLGLVIDGAGTELEARLAETDSIAGTMTDSERARIGWCLERLHAAYGPTPVAFSPSPEIDCRSPILPSIRRMGRFSVRDVLRTLIARGTIR